MKHDRVGELIAVGLDRAAAELAVRETLSAEGEGEDVQDEEERPA